MEQLNVHDSCLTVVFVTLAISSALNPGPIDVGAPWVIFTEMRVGGVIVMIALAFFVGSAVEVTVMVAVPPTGTTAGGVYVLFEVLWADPILPHAPGAESPQVNVQSIPCDGGGSLLTVADI